jgi:quercetin dioxygenase-like cupin family protein
MMNYVIDPEQVEWWSLNKHTGVSAKLLADGKNMTVLYTNWDVGSIAPEHTHPHEQMGMCLQGEVIFTVDSVDYLVKAGEFYQIPGGRPHAERNEGGIPAILVDFFSPIREDLLRRQFEAKTVE